MCGICGEIRLDAGAVDRGGVQTMLRAMVHRGPDAEGLLQAPGLAAGIRRLAVIDPAGGDQPMANEDGTVEVVFNGEIYNFFELRRELESKGHRFATLSDTEVLVHLWEEHGPEMLHRLNGMFAICLHDRKHQRTFLARDRMGIKPLFWSRGNGRIFFASELSVLLAHPDVDDAVDYDALLELFVLQYTGGEQTLYRAAQEVPPGTSIDIRDGRIEQRLWWELPHGESAKDCPEGVEEERIAELFDLVESAVGQRTVADVPLGMFLSGGLDSGIVCAMLSKCSNHPVQSFSVGFDDEAAFDEREHARRIADHFGAVHDELVVSATSIAEHLPELIDHLRMPVTDPAILPTWMLSRFARQAVTVVLTGEGADELFAGYRRYLYQDRLGWLGKVPGAKAVKGWMPRRIEQALEAVGEDRPERNHLLWSATIGLSLATRLFDADRVRETVDLIAGRWERYFRSDNVRLEDQLAADQAQWLPYNLLAKVDRATMAHSLEARVPFLDHRVVEWAARQPASMKIRGNVSKYALRRAFGNVLPEATLQRPKRGFDLPLAAWIRGPLRPLAEQAIDAAEGGLWPALNAATARALLDEHLGGKQDHGLPLFLLVSFLTFLEKQR